MANIYSGQTALEIRLNLFEDLTNKVFRVLIKYRKPNGFEGYWPAEIIDYPNGVISYTFPTSSLGLDDTGFWTFWAYVYYRDGSVIPGDPVQVGVYNEGKTYIAFPYGKQSGAAEEIQMAQEAFEILYDNTNSEMVAANVQDAIDELDTRIDNMEIPGADVITYDNSGSGLTAITVQTAIDELASDAFGVVTLIARANQVVYVDQNRTDSYTETGNIHYPYKTLAAAVAAVTGTAVIKVSRGTFTENIALPGNVNMIGMGVGKTILTGTVQTGASGNCSLRDMTVSNDITILCDTVVSDIDCSGIVTVQSGLRAHNFDIISSTSQLRVTSGLSIIENSIISSGNASAVLQTGGTLVLDNVEALNNSATNATIDSSTAVIRIQTSSAKNTGGGLAIDIDNGAAAGSPNVLQNVIHSGGINTGTAYTVQEGVEGGDPTGTNFSRRPATQIGFNNTLSGLTAVQVQAALDEAYGSCKSGTADPTYTPARIPEFFFRTDTNVLWVWNGTAWKYATLT